ncbi:cysteine hydrolase family protein [Neisseria weaveri]|uniref:cysteine hydrolase n=1 Tax=Neisseria weaveri TaxID=28091 RepID=UPI000D323128|nr:cysteine hydrolase [Neisseria weaveri]
MSNHKDEQIDQSRRNALGTGSRLAMAATVLGAMGVTGAAAAAGKKTQEKGMYDEPEQYGLKRHGMKIDPQRVALLVVDPQIDFLSPKGVLWGAVGKNVMENNTVENLERLFKAAKAVGMLTIVSPHYYYPQDHQWAFGGPGEHAMHDGGAFARKGAYTLEGFEGSGADFMPQYKPYIFDGKTVIASPHKVFGPESNDVVLQLRKRKIDQVILAGMSANLCIESHLRELIEQGFEVAVVKDATAGTIIPEGDGYQAALANFRIIANDLWTTDQAVRYMKG